MNLLFNIYLSTLLLILPDPSSDWKAVKLWETTDILTTSESVCYYEKEKVIFVSCINGKPTDKDGNGFISMISLSGEIITHHWATELNAPKGMGISGNSLFVTDIDRVVQFSLDDGSFQMEYPVQEAKFLNDIAVDELGNVFVSDMSSNNIYKVEKGIISLWVSNEILVRPNGLNTRNGTLFVGTQNGIFSIDQNKKISHLVENTGGIDGLELFENGYFIISDWQGKVQLVHPEEKFITLFNTTDMEINAADIHYVSDRNLLLVPTFFDNRVMAYELITK